MRSTALKCMHVVSFVSWSSVGRCFDARRIWFPAIQRECQATVRHSKCSWLRARPSVDPIPEEPETLLNTGSRVETHPAKDASNFPVTRLEISSTLETVRCAHYEEGTVGNTEVGCEQLLLALGRRPQSRCGGVYHGVVCWFLCRR